MVAGAESSAAGDKDLEAMMQQLGIEDWNCSTHDE